MSQFNKFLALFIILIVFQQHGTCEKVSAAKRIINGILVSDLTFIASIHVTLRNDEIRICVGSIISNYFVITSATCLYGLPDDNWTGFVRVGTFRLLGDGVQHNFVKMLEHPDYNFKSREADLLLIEVQNEIVFNEYVSPIKIDFSQIRGGARVYTAGWGAITPDNLNTPSDDLMFVSDETMNTLECQTQLQDRDFNFTLHFDDSICIHGMSGGSLCNYDYGAPLVHENKLIAIWSWGAPDCKGDYPYVFTRVSPHVNWISKHHALQ